MNIRRVVKTMGLLLVGLVLGIALSMLKELFFTDEFTFERIILLAIFALVLALGALGAANAYFLWKVKHGLRLLTEEANSARRANESPRRGEGRQDAADTLPAGPGEPSYQERASPHMESPRLTPAPSNSRSGDVAGAALPRQGEERTLSQSYEVPASDSQQDRVGQSFHRADWMADVLDGWRDYRENGEGDFNPKGLEQRLRYRGVQARVISGTELGVGNCLVGVTEGDLDHYFLLPDFTAPLTAVTRWFEDLGTGDRTRRVTRVSKPAVLSRDSRRGAEWRVEKGVVS